MKRLFSGAPFYRELLDGLLEGVYFVDSERAISFWNRGAEQLTGYAASEVIGRHCSDDILMHTDENGTPLCASPECPAAQVMASGITREQIIYLRHREGHRLPVNTRITPMREGAQVIGAVEAFSDASAMLEQRARLSELTRAALLDPLTGVGNRRYAEMMLQDRMHTFDRYAWPFGVLFVDVDDFKTVNDTHGHAVGDDVLRMLASTLRHSVRLSDTVARWGGEEFVVVLANMTAEGVGGQAERVRQLVERSVVRTSSGPLRVTVSIGAVAVPPRVAPDEVIERADALMYQAKRAGRNRVCLP
jgi:diguanylate cyclase (GGDEF)-like protein/PAS domain S-box-containing protein